MNELQEQIGKRLQEIRTKYFSNEKLSANQFAEIIGENKYNIGNYERGIANVPNRVLLELYKLGINPIWILSGEGSVYTDAAKSDYGKLNQGNSVLINSSANSIDLTEQLTNAVRAAAGDIAAILKADLER